MTDAPSFPAQLRRHAAATPDAVAVVHHAPDGSETSLTWRELDDRSSQLAAAFAARAGVGQGDRVSIAMPNTPQLVLATFAAWKLGAVPVPIRWDLPDWERDRLREVVEARLDLGEADVAWIDATADDAVPDLPDAVSPAANGICSSGSTGLPKVIVMGFPARYHEAISTPMYVNWGEVPRPQVILVMAPMYHTTGFSTLFTLLGGDRLVLLQKFDAERAVDAIERHGVSTFTATPTMLARIAAVAEAGDRDLSSIEWILQGAAPMPPSLVDRWIALIGAERIVMAYGMTEAVGLTALRGDDWLTHRGSVGRGLRGTELRILDPEGVEVPTGEVGDIYLRSPTFGSSTYLGATSMPETTDGFATVGDMGRVDEDGYLYLADRRVDLIVTGGVNVYPAEVEMALVDHPAIADVVVLGLQDEEWGRRVHAVVEPVDPAAPPTLGDVVAFAKARLASYKVPKTMELLAAIPRTSTTKVRRGAMVAERGG